MTPKKVHSTPESSDVQENALGTAEEISEVDKPMQQFMYFWNLLYRYLYFIGVQYLRVTRKRKKHFRKITQYIRTVFKKKFEEFQNDISYATKRRMRAITDPFQAMKYRYTDFCIERKDAIKRTDRNEISVWASFATDFFKGLFKFVKFVLSYAAPVAAVYLCVLTIQHYDQLNYALEIEYSGEHLGYVEDESVFNKAQQLVESRIIYEDTMPAIDSQPYFTLEVVDKQQITDEEHLANQLIQISGSELEEAYGLYIAGRFIGATQDGKALLTSMDNMLRPYMDGSAQTRVEFVKSVRITPKGLYPTSSIISIEEFEELFHSETTGEQKYTVISGDVPTTIADKNGIPYSQLKALNPEIEKSLFPGDEILITQKVPYLQVRTIKTITYSEEIPYKITQKTDNNYDIGYTKITQNGQNGEKVVTADVVMVDGVEVERTIVDTDIVDEPVEQILLVGGNKPLAFIPSVNGGSAPSGSFMWPVDGSTKISAGFYGYVGHTGLDIEARSGTGIRAVADGVVVYARQYGPYGKHIIINHGGGLQTLYAHASVLYVGAGTQVKQGQLIAGVGRTGNASGNHLHIEFRQNGRFMNPAKYLY